MPFSFMRWIRVVGSRKSQRRPLLRRRILPKFRSRIIQVFAVLLGLVVLASVMGGCQESIPSAEEQAGHFVETGEARLNAGEYDKAIPAFDEAIRLSPTSGRAYEGRGRAYGARGEWDRAIADLTEALKRGFDGDGSVYANRGGAYRGKKAWDLAIADFTEALNRGFDGDGWVYVYRGTAYARKGDLEAALSDYSKAIETNPRDPIFLNGRGWTYLRLERDEEALKDLNAAIALKPLSGIYDSRGWAYFFLGDYDKASADAEEAMRLDPALTWVKALQFRILVARGKREEAVAMAEKTLQDLAPDDLARPVLEYFLGKRTLADLKERFPQNWINYEVAVRGYEPAPR